MNNRSKIKKIILTCMSLLAVGSLSVLAPFTALKKANADTVYPPVYAIDGGTTLADTPFSLYEVSLIRGVSTAFGGDADAFSTYSVDAPRTSITDDGSTSIGYPIDEPSMQALLRFDNQSSTALRVRADFTEQGLPAGGFQALRLATYRPFYTDEGMYNRLLKSIQAPIRISVQSASADYLTVSYTINYEVIADDALLRDSISATTDIPIGTSFNVSGFLPVFTTLTASADYPDYVYIESVSITFNTVYTSVTADDTASFRLTASGTSQTALSYTGYVDTQIQGVEYFKTYTIRPVDDIGIGTITNAVADFLNVEFIPGFRLWYFLLIGLGVAITGLALKFFLGG